MKERTRLAVMVRMLGVAMAVALMGVVVAFADSGVTGTITLTGGSLAVTAQDVTVTGVTLDGQDHNDVSGTTTGWYAEDPTGTGAGWHVDVASSDFITGSYSIAVAGFDIRLLDDDVTVNYGNTKPTSSVTNWTPLTHDGVTVLSAAVGEGMGSYAFTPTFQLDVPAEIYAGNYTAYITVTISSGP